MQNLRKRMLVGFAAALGALAFAGSASALSLSLEFSGGATTLNLTAADISTTHTVQLFADLTGGGGGGVFFVSASVSFSNTLTPGRCKEQGGTVNNGVGGVPSWAPLTVGCGRIGQAPGGHVQSMEQRVASALKRARADAARDDPSSM